MHLPNFVKKNGAPVGQLKTARLVLDRAGIDERPHDLGDLSGRERLRLGAHRQLLEHHQARLLGKHQIQEEDVRLVLCDSAQRGLADRDAAVEEFVAAEGIDGPNKFTGLMIEALVPFFETIELLQNRAVTESA